MLMTGSAASVAAVEDLTGAAGVALVLVLVLVVLISSSIRSLARNMQVKLVVGAVVC
jgi:uncharacterized membrane protein